MKKTIILGFVLLSFVVLSTAQAMAQTIPENARRHMARGQAAVEMANSPDGYESAIKEFSEAARLAPGWPAPYYNLALLQEKTGKFKEAAASLEEYLRLAPKAPDAGKIRDRIYKLEYKAEQTLTVADIIEVLVSGFSLNAGWKVSAQDAAGNNIPQSAKCGGGFGDLQFSRNGVDSVKTLEAIRYYPVREYYQTLTVTGPALKYTTVINVCDKSADAELGGCDAVTQHEIEVASKNIVKVKQTVLRGGFGAGVATGEKTICLFHRGQ